MFETLTRGTHRSDFHRWVAAAPFSILLLVLLVGFGQAQTTYNEAPMLAERVAAGELPPIGERLPENPLVVEPVERIGEYGGEWRMSLVDASPSVRTMAYENLMRWNAEGTEVIPNIAELVEVNEAGTEFTFRLREGMKWSDGQPFTADDIMFWYEDVFLNEELTTAKPSWLMSGEEPVVVEKVDDTTVTFRFAQPNGIFLTLLATPDGSAFGTGAGMTSLPRHYLEQFHENYNPDVGALVAEAGADDWVSLFQSRATFAENSALPVLFPWRLTTVPGESTTQAVAERNPYYFKVDPEGNQLPYIDRLVYEIVNDAQVALLRALNGEYSFPHGVDDLENKAVFFDNMERGDYRFITYVRANMNVAIFALNLASKDPAKRDIFSNKDFRIGLSHAINRPELVDLIFFGQTEPWQAAPLPGSVYYDEEMATQYTEYDVALANEHLDRVLPGKDAQGFRLGPDGRRFRFVLEASTHSEERLGIAELLVGYFRDVGVDMQLRPMDRDLFYERKEANEHDATIWSGPGGLLPTLDPRWYFPHSVESNFAVPWAAWYEGDTTGEEPPEAPRRQMELYDRLLTTADPEEQEALFKELLEIAEEQFYVIGVAQEPEGYSIVQNSFHNVPGTIPEAFQFASPALTNPEQYFIEGTDQSSAP